MPAGWSLQNDGSYINNGVAGQSDAIERGGAFKLNLETKTLDIVPWSDGSGDILKMRPILPDGVTLTSGLTETDYGWKASMSNGWSFWLVDMQAPKVSDALSDFLPEGMAVVYGSIPVGEVPLTGEWRPKKIRFFNYEDYNFFIQPDESGNPDVTQPKWVPGSIAIYHKTKQNNMGGKKYMTGKLTHLPRPLMVGWRNGQVTGWTFGEYQDLGGGIFEKVFDMDAIIAAGDMTRKGIGNPITVSVSADLGYTTEGASYTNQAREVYYKLGTMPVNGKVDSLSCAHNAAAALTTNDWGCAVYAGVGLAGDPLVDSLGPNINPDSIVGSWVTGILTSQSVSSGDVIIAAINQDRASSVGPKYDVNTSTDVYFLGASPPFSPWPVTLGDSMNGDNRAYSMYITYSAGGSSGEGCNCSLGIGINI